VYRVLHWAVLVACLSKQMWLDVTSAIDLEKRLIYRWGTARFHLKSFQLLHNSTIQCDSPVLVLLEPVLANMIELSAYQATCTVRRLSNSSTDDGSNDCPVQIRQQRKKFAKVALSKSIGIVHVPIADPEWMKSICNVGRYTATRGYRNRSTRVATTGSGYRCSDCQLGQWGC